MAQRLRGYLYQASPEGGRAEVFPAGLLRSDLPDWVRADDGAFVDDQEETAEPAAHSAPPRAGKGSGRDEWASYAEGLGIEVAEGAGRDEIIAAVDAL